MWMSSLIIIITFSVCGLILLGLSYVFYKYIYTVYKQTSEAISPDLLLSMLNVIIETEFAAYDNTIFQSIGNITNSQYDNYYNMISTTLITNISPTMMYHFSRYTSDEFVYRMVARRVKEYLKQKISGVV